MGQVKVVPLVLSATGVVPKTLHKHNGLKFIIRENTSFYPYTMDSVQNIRRVSYVGAMVGII